MTVIIAYVDPSTKHSYILGDSAAAGPDSIGTIAFPKVWKSDGVLIGYTSSFRQGQLIERYMKVPKRLSSQSPLEFMQTTYVEELMTWLQKGFAALNNGGVLEGGEFIVVYESVIYRVQSDFSVLTYGQDFLAIGSGADVALGAMHALDDFDLKPKERLLRAAEASSEFRSTVRGPFTVLKKKSKES